MATRTVIVGMGRRGRDWAREVLAASDYDLVGCVDTDEASVAESTRAFSLDEKLWFNSPRQALEASAADLVIVATPADHHVAPCEAALTHGCAVLVEKPFTMHLSDAASLVTQAEAAGCPLLVAQNYRYMRAFRTVRRLVAAGGLGPLRAVHGHYYRVPHEMAPSLARLTHCALFGVAVHHLDVIRCIVDDQVHGVFATSTSSRQGSPPSGASLSVQLAFGGGAQATYTASYESTGHEYFEGGQEFYARFVGERGTLHMLHRWLVLCENGRLPRLVRRGPRRQSEERVLLDHMTQTLATAEPADSDGRDNLQTMAVVEACVQSAATRVMTDPRSLLRDALN